MFSKIFDFIQEHFDIDIAWVLGIIGLMAYGTIVAQVKYEQSLRRLMNEAVEIKGTNYENISDIIVKCSNQVEEIPFLTEKNVTISTKTFNKKKKLVVTCTEVD
jgi:hypothetical protein